MIIKKIINIVQKLAIYFFNEKQYIEYLKKQGLNIGENCVISKSAYFGGEPWLVSIGNNSRITDNVKFITHDGGLWVLRHLGMIPNEAVKYGAIRIGNNCNISWNVIILPGVTIGDNCVVGAGSVVTKNIPAGTVWAGVPAHFIESIEDYKNKVVNNTYNTYSMRTDQKKKYLEENAYELFK